MPFFNKIVNRMLNKGSSNAISLGKLFAVTLLSANLLACSSTDDEEDTSDLPVELTEINEKFEPVVLWDRSVGDGSDDFFSRLKPIAAYNNVYSASRSGIVVALNAETGEEVWEVDLSNINNERGFFEASTSAMLAGGPVAGSNKIFIGSESGKVFALDATTGELSWEASIKGEIINAPAVDSGILIVNTVSGIMQAYNAETGEELWKVEQDVPALTLRGVSQPVIASGGVLIGTGKGSVGVYLLQKGQQGWETEVGEATGSTELERVIDVDSAPVVFGDKIYAISSRGNLAAIELQSGRIVWKRQYSSYRELSVFRNDIYLTNTSGHVYAINRINGIERWSNLGLANRGVTGPVVVDKYIVVGDFEGYLHWLDMESGEIVARHEVDSSGIDTSPTVVGNILYTQSIDGDLEAIETPKLIEASN